MYAGTNPIAPSPTPLERSRTALQPGVGVRPNAATIIASRRTKSDSNPPNIPLPAPPLPSDLSRSNTALRRSNTARSARNPTASAGVPLRPKPPQSTAGGIAGVGAGGLRVGAETGAAAGGAQTLPKHRPSARRPQGQGTPQVAQQSSPQPPFPPFQPGQFVNPPQGVTPLVLPAALAPGQVGECSSLVFIIYSSSNLRSSHEHAAELTLFV